MISSRNEHNAVGVGINGIHLGRRAGYATTAAAEAAWREIAARDPGFVDANGNSGVATDEVPYGGALAYLTDGTLRYYNAAASGWTNIGAGAAVGALDAVYTNGQAIDVDLGAVTFNDATAAGAHTIDINKTGAGTGGANVLNIDISGAHAGNVIDIDYSALATGDALNILMTGADAAAQAIVVSSGTAVSSTPGWALEIILAAATTGSALEIRSSAAATGAFIHLDNTSSTGAVLFDVDVNGAITADVFDIDATTGSGNIFAVNFSGAWNADVLNIVLTNAANGAQALVIDSGSRAISAPLIDLNVTGAVTPTAPLIDIDVAWNAGGVAIIDLDFSSTFAGDALNLNMTNAVGARVLSATLAGVRTAIGFDIDVPGTGGVAVFDVTTSGAYTGDFFHLDNTTATGSRFFNIDVAAEGHSVPVFDIDTASTGADIIFDIRNTGVGSGRIFAYSTNAAHTGTVLDVDVDGAVAQRVALFNSSGLRTVPTLDINSSSTGAESLIDVDVSGVWTGSLLAIASAGAGTGSMVLLEPAAAAVGATVLRLDLLASVRTAPAVDINSASTGAEALIDIDISGAGSGDAINITTAAAFTGDLIHLVAATATAARSLNIDVTAISTVPVIDIDVTAAASGNIFDFATDSAYSGNVLEVNLTNAVAAAALFVTAAGVRTDSIIEIATTATGASQILDIDLNGAASGNCIDITDTAAYTGAFLAMTTASATGARLLDLNAAAANTVDLIDIDCTGAGSGDVIDIATGAVAYTGAALHVSPDAVAVGMTPILVDIVGSIRTVPVIDINSASTGAEALIDIDLTGVWTGTILDIRTAAGAGTGDLVRLVMDGAGAGAQALVASSNVVFTSPMVDIDGSAAHTAALVDILSAGGAGAANVAACLNINLTGAGLVATADVARIATTTSLAADSHILALEQSVGAGTAGSQCLYISAGGANVEAIWVDAGVSQFDEQIQIGTTPSGNTTVIGGSAAGVAYAGTHRPYRSVWISGDLLTAGASAGSTEATRNNSQVWLLDGAGATESLRLRVPVPNGYADATNVRVAIYAAPTTSAAGNVVWRVDFLSVDTGTALDSALTTGTAAAALAQTGTAEQLDIYGETLAANVSRADANLIVPGTTLSDGEYLIVEIVRLSADGGDTYGADMAVYGVKLEFQMDGTN